MDSSDKRLVLVYVRCVDLVLMGLLLYVFLIKSPPWIFFVIVAASSLAYSTMSAALSSAYRHSISTQNVAA